jgi:hypothetical protein
MQRVHKREILATFAVAALCAVAACSGQPQLSSDPGNLPSSGGSTSTGGVSGAAGSLAGMGGLAGTAGTIDRGGTTSSPPIDVTPPAPTECPDISCMELGYACGSLQDECGNIVNCADQGLTCGPLEACTGGVDAPTQCVTSLGEDCTACAGVPDCSTAAQVTKLTGRVITAGRDDANAANQLGVPNAFVYILRTNDEADLPPITSGIPAGGTSCDRCEDQDLGPLLVGGLTDATGAFTLEGNIPVGMEFLLVVKAGRFRRAIRHTIPAEAACTTVALPATLPENPTRLPRTMTDGLAVNLPRIAVTTGRLDAIECVLEKMGVAHAEFGNPGDGSAAPRVHMYQGGPDNAPTGAVIDDSTPHDVALYGDLSRITQYDIVISDCEGQDYDGNRSQREEFGGFLREYVNRGGRLFASHLSFTWLEDNGDAPYDAADPVATGLDPAAEWSNDLLQTASGTGMISVGRPQASPRIQNFADWMVNEGVTTVGDNSFDILDPRSQNTALGASAEEFVYQSDGLMRVQQFSISTPYGAPEEAVCGRISHSGFHVSIATGSGTGGTGGTGGAGGTGGMAGMAGMGMGGTGMGFPPMGMDNANAVFPMHCRGDLTPQEKVLLYMLFDLAACVGEVPPPPACTPATCESLEVECGFTPDGCGAVIDCGPCVIEPPK